MRRVSCVRAQNREKFTIRRSFALSFPVVPEFSYHETVSRSLNMATITKIVTNLSLSPYGRGHLNILPFEKFMR